LFFVIPDLIQNLKILVCFFSRKSNPFFCLIKRNKTDHLWSQRWRNLWGGFPPPGTATTTFLEDCGVFVQWAGTKTKSSSCQESRSHRVSGQSRCPRPQDAAELLISAALPQNTAVTRDCTPNGSWELKNPRRLRIVFWSHSRHCFHYKQ